MTGRVAILIFVAAMSGTVNARTARTLRLNDRRTEVINVTPGQSTILSFPARPTKVVLGNTGAFSIQYIENDLAVSALSMGAKSNLFIYLDGRRFGFDLRTTPSGGDEIVVIRDEEGSKWKVKVKMNDTR